MIDRPDAAQLLEAMAATLTNQVMPSLDGGPKHSARVVANLCGILAREWNHRADVPLPELQALLAKPDADYADLVAELDRRLTDDGLSDEFAAAAHPIVMAETERRLAIDKPGYLDR
jgi:hypothetical protein